MHTQTVLAPVGNGISKYAQPCYAFLVFLLIHTDYISWRSVEGVASKDGISLQGIFEGTDTNGVSEDDFYMLLLELWKRDVLVRIWSPSFSFVLWEAGLLDMETL